MTSWESSRRCHDLNWTVFVPVRHIVPTIQAAAASAAGRLVSTASPTDVCAVRPMHWMEIIHYIALIAYYYHFALWWIGYASNSIFPDAAAAADAKWLIFIWVVGLVISSRSISPDGATDRCTGGWVWKRGAESSHVTACYLRLMFRSRYPRPVLRATDCDGYFPVNFFWFIAPIYFI